MLKIKKPHPSGPDGQRNTLVFQPLRMRLRCSANPKRKCLAHFVTQLLDGTKLGNSLGQLCSGTVSDGLLRRLDGGLVLLPARLRRTHLRRRKRRTRYVPKTCQADA